MDRIGILLVGGYGTRLNPVTNAVNKHLLPIYNKPMIYYSLSLFLLVGIKEIVVICDEESVDQLRKILYRSSRLGITYRIITQPRPEGIAQAFHLSAGIIKSRNVMLVLGDTFVYGAGLRGILLEGYWNNGATIYGYETNKPSAFGIAEVREGKVVSIEEKPQNPRSNMAIPGIYFYDKEALNISLRMRMGARGEYEITDINKEYLENNNLNYIKMHRGISWFDTGTFENIYEASTFVRSIEESQGLMIACLEEIALNSGTISITDLKELVNEQYESKSEYDNYVRSLVSRES
jgi:glucose-1-phosphate thymidylyltransferase